MWRTNRILTEKDWQIVYCNRLRVAKGLHVYAEDSYLCILAAEQDPVRYEKLLEQVKEEAGVRGAEE